MALQCTSGGGCCDEGACSSDIVAHAEDASSMHMLHEGRIWPALAPKRRRGRVVKATAC